jgi:hypothetical protein
MVNVRATRAVVQALPAGCVSKSRDGCDVFNCSSVIYKPQFKSNNLVYVGQ